MKFQLNDKVKVISRFHMSSGLTGKVTSITAHSETYSSKGCLEFWVAFGEKTPEQFWQGALALA